MQVDNVANQVLYKRYYARIKRGFEYGEYSISCCNTFLGSLAKKLKIANPYLL